MTKPDYQTSREPQQPKAANRPQCAVIETAERLGFDLTEPLLHYVPSVWPDAKVKGDQWAIAKGDAIAKLGSSTGSLADDRAMAYERLTGLADWAERIRLQPAVASTINQSRTTKRQYERLTARASQLDAESIRLGNQVLNEKTLALVYDEPFKAMVAMREIVGETGNYQDVVDALKDDPEQFGTIRKRSALSVILGTAEDQSARATLDYQIIPDLEEASGKQRQGRRARRSAEQLLKDYKIDHELLEFADAVDHLNRELIGREFRAVEADIQAHQRYEALVADDPVAGLELAQAKALSVDGSRLWYDIAAAASETVRDDDTLASEAEARGIMPERTLPRHAREEPGWRDRPRRSL